MANRVLTDEEKQRYLRQLNLPTIGENGQQRLKQSTAFIAGLGGLGSVSSLYLAAAGIGRLRITDYDTVDTSNLNRQILHASRDIGRPKTDSAVEKLRALNPHCEITALYEEIDKDNVRELAGDADIIVDSTDNLRTRKALNRASVGLDIPFVYGGINGFNGTVSTFIPGQTPCFECLFGNFKEPAASPDAIGPIVALVGAIQSLEAIKYILKMDGLLTNQLLMIDAIKMTFKKIAVDRDTECAICGDLEKEKNHA